MNALDADVPRHSGGLDTPGIPHRGGRSRNPEVGLNVAAYHPRRVSPRQATYFLARASK